MLSRQKDTDFLILEKLDDKSLFQVCLVNKELNKLCNDNQFWYKRFINKFGNDYEENVKDWRKRYLTVIKHLDMFRLKPWHIFYLIDRHKLNTMKNFPIDLPLIVTGSKVLFKNAPSKILDNFYFTNLGEILRVGHMIDDPTSYTPYRHYPFPGERFVTPLSLLIDTYKINPKSKFNIKSDRINNLYYFK